MSVDLIEMNEVNFDLVKKYIGKNHALPNFEKLLSMESVCTSSENEYHLVEPWIQWVSVHTGLTYHEHNVFHLGDIAGTDHQQIFEKLERRGYKVGALSPMNAMNNLEDPAYFIPDPWTDTQPDNSFLAKALSFALRQTVNDNAQGKITFTSLVNLCFAILVSLGPIGTLKKATQIPHALSSSWRKAIYLDTLLFEIWVSLNHKKNPDFSVLFLNAGAHIQHHYFNSSKVENYRKRQNPRWYIDEAEDPVLEVLQSYDAILGRLLANKDRQFVLCTAMSQEPYDDQLFYYRLRSHEDFFSQLRMEFLSISPRMTRDFEVHFVDNTQRDIFCDGVEQFFVGHNKIFKVQDKSDTRAFITLIYPNEILPETQMQTPCGQTRFLFEHVAFVATKNGHHIDKGWVFKSPGLPRFNFKDGAHVCSLFGYLDSLFPSR